MAGMNCQIPLSLSGACHEDVAASTSRRHAGLSIVRRLAVARPKLSGPRSSSTVLRMVCLGLPVLRRQSLGGPRMQARRAREWSWPMSARHRWPKKDKHRWRIVSDRSGCPVRDRTTSWRQNPSNGYCFSVMCTCFVQLFLRLPHINGTLCYVTLPLSISVKCIFDFQLGSKTHKLRRFHCLDQSPLLDFESPSSLVGLTDIKVTLILVFVHIL